MMKIVFAGTPEFAVPLLQALIHSTHEIIAVYTQPDRPAGRGQHLHASPIKLLALQHHLTLFQPKSLRDVSAQQQLHDLNADLMIVAAYGLILPQVVLSLPRLGCINVHASLLPRWRGAAPIQRAILAGDIETGITIMQMDVGLDTGTMLHRIPCAITANDTAQSLHDRLASLGASALLQVLPAIEMQTLNPVIQNEAHACYASKITKEEACIDWHKTTSEIDRAVRAYTPFPIAYSFLDNQLVKIWEAEIIFCSHQQVPGAIVQTNATGIDVATGDGVIRLKKLQLAGGKALHTHELLNSRAAMFAVGKKFSCHHDYPQ
jgi:methionyl-tRNA formyltransferase